MREALKLDPIFLTTRETFPGEKTFSELSRQFFSGKSADERSVRVMTMHERDGLLVHMANPEQIDDLFAHIDREKKVRYLSTCYLHKKIRGTVYAIGRGTGILIDSAATKIEHVSVNDSNTVTDAQGKLVVSNHAVMPNMSALHDALLVDPKNEWSEVNVSFAGPDCIVGFFALDGVLSKLYATALYLKAGRLLPVFTYNRQLNRLAEYHPTFQSTAELIEEVPSPELQGHYRSLLGML